MNDSELLESSTKTMKSSPCVWDIGGLKCDGDISIVEFKSLYGPYDIVKIPMCEVHRQHHYKILDLHKLGREIKDVVSLTSEEIDKELK